MTERVALTIVPQCCAKCAPRSSRIQQALVRHDVEAINAFFLNSAHAVRFGLAEQNYGIEAIAAYRRNAPPVHSSGGCCASSWHAWERMWPA